jgi:hypothetical protein
VAQPASIKLVVTAATPTKKRMGNSYARLLTA